jgi:glycosyltransferase involved in cell wall biosynthesis
MAKQKKIILIYIWDMDIGGVQKRVRDIVYYLDKYHPEYQIELLIKRAYDTHLLGQVKKLKRVNIQYFSTYPGKIWWPSIFWITIKYWQLKPDVVLTFLDRLSVQMAILKKIFFWYKVKLILNEGIFTTVYLKMYENKLWHKLVKICYPLADVIVVPTKTIQQDLNKNFAVPLAKLTIIPNWALLQSKTTTKKIYDFIYAGRLEKEKNIFWLIDLIIKLKKKYPRVSLCILGSGQLEYQLHYQINKYKLTKNIFFYGFVDNVINYLAQARTILLPSLNEGLPNCVIEAGIQGLPAVVYNFQGAEEVVIHSQTGFIAKDKKEFLYYTEKLIKANSLRIKLGENARALVKQKFGSNNLKAFTNLLIS